MEVGSGELLRFHCGKVWLLSALHRNYVLEQSTHCLGVCRMENHERMRGIIQFSELSADATHDLFQPREIAT